MRPLTRGIGRVRSVGQERARSRASSLVGGPASRLAFGVPPSATAPAGTITPAVTVRVENGGGQLVAGSTASIVVALTSAGGATLGGTKTRSAVAGVATFDDLTVDNAGVYSLTATSTGLTSAVSLNFTVGTPPAGTPPVTRGLIFGGGYHVTGGIK